MKKLLSLVLIAFVIIAMTGTTFAVTVTGSVYSDQTAPGASKPTAQIEQELAQMGIVDVEPTDWFAGSITVLVEAGLLTPNSNGEINPHASVDNGRGIAVFAKILGMAPMNVSDEEAVQLMEDAGLIESGISIDDEMTRAQFARLIALALGVEAVEVLSPADYPFADYDAALPEDRGIFKALYIMNTFLGSLDNGVLNFNPNDALTTAQLATLMDRILGGIG